MLTSIKGAVRRFAPSAFVLVGAIVIGTAVAAVERHGDGALRDYARGQTRVVATALKRANEQELFLSCVRGNGSRSVALINGQQISRSAFELDLTVAPLLDCRATIRNDNRGVPLRRGQQLAYLAIVKQHKIPMVDPHGVVHASDR